MPALSAVTAEAGNSVSSGIPTISFSYNLADVASAIGSNFNAIWLIVAFAVGIPLAFKFAGNIKELFS